jgi:Sap-like sulfolipid-1-addressing protein
MSAEALVLALTTVVRPTSLAAVAAMLSTRQPQRLLAAYLAAGLVFSLAVGTLVVVLLGGLHTTRASPAVRPALDLVIGACALGYATGSWIGWLPRPGGAESEQDGWMRRRLADLSRSGAAVAGVLTHLPGLVYLAALNAIADTATGDVGRVLQVVVYNAIWFSLAITALVLSVHRPDVSREVLERIVSLIGRHQRMIVVGFLGALGGYLVVVGVLGLFRIAS